MRPLSALGTDRSARAERSKRRNFKCPFRVISGHRASPSGMSALRPIADIYQRGLHVCFVPEVDIPTFPKLGSDQKRPKHVTDVSSCIPGVPIAAAHIEQRDKRGTSRSPKWHL